MERTGWILVTSCLVALVASQGCPDEDLNLKKWSDDATWNGQLPQEGDSLVIQDGDSFLLDTSPPPLDSITIESGGKLVVADGMDIKLSVKYILIRGEMHVGSEDCKFTGKLHITLRGNLGEYKVDGFGEKFIGVASGGVLEIHGEYRLPWTKLSSNVKAVDFISNVKNIAINANKQDNAEVTDDDEDDEESDDVESDDDKSNTADATTDPNVRESIKMEALVIYVFNEQTGVMESAARLVTTGGKPKDFPKKVEETREVLDSIPAGRIVAIALKRRFRVGKVDTSGLFDMLEEWAYGAVDGSSLKFREYKFHGAWAMIKKQGDDSSIQELLLNDDGKPLRIAELYHMENGLKFSVRSWVHTVRRNQCYCRGKSSSLSIINLVDDVQTWRKGDQVVLLSTDFDWEQREFGNIIDCPSCTSNQLLLDLEPRFDHFGEIYKNVDMRGEVALTNRTIVIEGEADANGEKMGGHIKFLKGFKTVQVNNVELVRMGQQTSLGNYPLHFHMCGDVDDREKPSLLSGNSIRDSFARCITVHGSHGAQVKNNFCLNTLGHGYFLEDGGEKRTVLDGNLGAGQKRSSLIETDKFPTTFWITNPQTYVRNNVAAGGEGHGFWFVYPNQPWDASKAYKNMKQNAWINGGYIKVTQSSSSPQEQLLDHSVFVGDSPNIGSASVVSKFKTWGRSVPLEFADQPRQGFVFYHGPVYVSDTWFGNFADTDNYRSGALGFQRDNDGHSSPISAVSGIKFAFSDPLEGNRVFDGNATDTGFTENDGDLIGTFRDTDGTVYKAGAQIVKDILFHTTSNCVQRTNWKMMACEETFGQVRLSWGSWGWKAKSGASDVSIYRDDLPDNPIAADSKQQAPFMALLGGQYSYMARMNGNMPKSVKFTALGFTKAQTARVGLCVPRDATVKVKFLDLSDSSWKKGSEVTSLDELDASTNPTDFFADSEVGVVFFKPMHDREYTSTDLTDCLDGTCPSVTVTVSGGDSTDSDCISRAYPKYQRESSDVSLVYVI
uniref:Transmembrane protein 2 n=1 Tax=Magallana gigas TaxID=29159 RepID=K1QC76_MAGGI